MNSQKRNLPQHRAQRKQRLQLHQLIPIEPQILLHTRHIRIIQIRLIDVLDPIRQHRVRHEKKIDFRNQPSILWRVVVSEPFQMVPLGARNRRHGESCLHARESRVCVCVCGKGARLGFLTGTTSFYIYRPNTTSACHTISTSQALSRKKKKPYTLPPNLVYHASRNPHAQYGNRVLPSRGVQAPQGSPTTDQPLVHDSFAKVDWGSVVQRRVYVGRREAG